MNLSFFYGRARVTIESEVGICLDSVFKGEHVKRKKHVSVLTGKEITVRFDRPTPLQIDGETHLNVTEYSAKAAVKSKILA